MRACPSCYHLNQDDANACVECFAPMHRDKIAPEKELSNNALAVAAIRRDYLEHPPSSTQLTSQQWYNVCKFFPKIAQRASDYTHRPLADVCPDNPLDRTASRGFLLVIQRRAPRERQPGEEG